MIRNFERIAHLELLKKHLSIPHPPVQVILGPRQVGKTTAILHFLKGWPGPSFYHTADQVSPPDALWLEKQWDEARRGCSTAGEVKPADFIGNPVLNEVG